MYIGVDLGSTNIKAALYDENMTLLDRQSRPVAYIRDNGFVEFDAQLYFRELAELLEQLVRPYAGRQVREIALTGQAESLVVLDKNGLPLMNAISWMDERSTEECAVLAEQFDGKTCEAVTGQMAVLPTWPATKILWLKKHRPEVYENAATYMLLKDYVVFCLTGQKLADMSIATFSFYFDIYRKAYWQEMLDAIGICREQLPELAEPCTVAGTLLPELAETLRMTAETKINIGTLDHFAGMVGTGNIRPGGITLSTGTVMAMATMCQSTPEKNTGIAMHYGFLPNSYVMLPVAESGGVSLEWLRRTCMGQTDYGEMNRVLAERGGNQLLFLPYLVGTNAPEFDADATGVFWGLRQEHDIFDMAHAVMEGVSFVLRKNCDQMTAAGMAPNAIIATGGGAKSAIWCQLQADITGLPVQIPAEKEAACLGVAMIAAISDGRFPGLEAAADHCVSFCNTFSPNPTEETEKKYRRFCALYAAALQIGRIC